MKKSELRNGMVVEYRDGSRRLVLDLEESCHKKLLGPRSNSSLFYYTEDLKSHSPCLDIMKVYAPSWATLEDLNSSSNLLWERQERNPEIERLEKLIDDAKEQIQKLKD